MESLAAFPVAMVSSLTLIGLAEIGDKSQLVCMTLAARYRPWPVLLGAVAAFALLNLVAVAFGATFARWLPAWLVAALVGLLFIGFGIHGLRSAAAEDGEELPEEKPGHGIFFSTFLLITLAEFGDKTQLTVAGLGGTAPPLAVWTGATLALAATSGVGVVAGRTLLQRIPVHLLRRFGGAFFVLLGLVALGSILW